MFDFVHPSGRVTQLSNTNKLVRFYDGCDGGKTGFTSEALSCLSATAKRGDTRLLCVVIGAPDSKTRNAEVSKLLNYGFANFETKTFMRGGEMLESRINVTNGKQQDVGCVVGQDVVLFGKKGEFKDCVVEKEFYDCSAPLRAGDKIGELKVLKDGELLASSDILADNDVDKKGFMDIVDEMIDKW